MASMHLLLCCSTSLVACIGAENKSLGRVPVDAFILPSACALLGMAAVSVRGSDSAVVNSLLAFCSEAEFAGQLEFQDHHFEG
jgi:hypothetical protein